MSTTTDPWPDAMEVEHTDNRNLDEILNAIPADVELTNAVARLVRHLSNLDDESLGILLGWIARSAGDISG